MLKPGEAFRIVHEHIGEDFERDVALQLRVAGSVPRPCRRRQCARRLRRQRPGSRSTNCVSPAQSRARRLHRRRVQKRVDAPADEEGFDLSSELTSSPARTPPRGNPSR